MEAQELNIFLEQPVKICYTTLIHLYKIILLKWQIHIGINDIVNNKNSLNTDHNIA